jgi:hypothetical protein
VHICIEGIIAFPGVIVCYQISWSREKQNARNSHKQKRTAGDAPPGSVKFIQCQTVLRKDLNSKYIPKKFYTRTLDRKSTNHLSKIEYHAMRNNITLLDELVHIYGVEIIQISSIY